ncbi:MAG: metallophosphoesterase [Alphaproteobacteria bacterium]
MIRLAHLSDLHIGPLPQPRLRELAGKRATGYLNWTKGRAHHHRMDILSAVLADIASAHVDHVAVTGDLINIGLEAEYAPGRAMLERVGEPDHVSFVPGNHDAYIRATAPHILSAWGPYLTGDHEPKPRNLSEAFPYVRRRGSVALIGVNSGVPKPPFLATGTVGRKQRVMLGETLAGLSAEGLARVVMIHHPPFDIGPQKRLTDYASVAHVLRDSGCDLVLHGHTHKGTVKVLEGPHGAIPVVGVPSASANPADRDEPAGWNLIEFDHKDGKAEITLMRRGFAPGGTAISTLFSRQLTP